MVLAVVVLVHTLAFAVGASAAVLCMRGIRP